MKNIYLQKEKVKNKAFNKERERYKYVQSVIYEINWFRKEWMLRSC